MEKEEELAAVAAEEAEDDGEEKISDPPLSPLSHGSGRPGSHIKLIMKLPGHIIDSKSYGGR